MPLRALSFGADLLAFEYDAVSWVELKRTYRSFDLQMPCCSLGAIPKTSKHGNFFFAHARRGDCTTAPESQEHIFLKTIVAKAAKSAGWAVSTERAGIAPNGECWIADVYCEKNKAKVALEIQMSYQSKIDLLSRQEIYKKSGIRAAWFGASKKFNAQYMPDTEEVPFFRVPEFSPNVEPVVEGFGVSISEFVTALLDKKITWHVEPWEYEFLYLEDFCWKCRKPVKNIYGTTIGVYREEVTTNPQASRILMNVASVISNEELWSLGLNGIDRYGALEQSSPSYPYRNKCIHCHALQINGDLVKNLHGGQKVLGSKSFLSPREGTGSWKFNND